MKGDCRRARVDTSAEAAFRPIERIGGPTGYYYGQWLWRARGLLDRLVGGPGLRPGREHAEQLSVGDVVDCWQVVALERGRLLRLEARMKMPGRGWLQFEVHPDDAGCDIVQSVVYEPHGWAGLLYWYVLYPIHIPVWSGMLRGIVRAALRD